MPTPRRLAVLAAALLAGPAAAVDPPAAPPAAAPASGWADAQTSVASSRSRRIRETPGVVTILTRDELLASGARDLAEVLVGVPGFELGIDVAGTVGAGFRGIWGHEGKILYLVDGVEMNDLSYGTFPLLRHLNVEQLDRVEIIRGPGSALYGGHAELAVVNVVTRAGLLDGGSVALTGGRVESAATAASLAAGGGATVGALRIGATASLGGGAASDQIYTDLSGDQVDLADASAIRPALVTARAAWRWLDVRAVYDDYALETADGYDAVLPAVADVRWRTAALDARGTFDLGGDVTLMPRVTYRWEKPWQETDPGFPDLYYDVTNEQLKGRVAIGWDTFVGPSVVAGVEGAIERGRIDDFSVTDPGTGEPLLSYAGERSVSYGWVAGFLEAEYDSRWVNLLAGARVEDHEEFGTAFVPRFAATRAFGAFHAKLLASGAYRTPSIENVNYAIEELRPERTTVYEAEVGWQVTDAVYAAANVFDVTVERPIVFSFAGLDAYTNEEQTGSRGVEAELQLRHRASTASLSYAWYSARHHNEVPAYAVAGDADLLAGFSGHKVIATARIRALRGLVISPTVTWLSERAAFDGSEAAGEPAAGRIGQRTYLDLFASWQDLGAKGIEVGLGFRDLLDEGTVHVQPYPGGHAPMPGNGREVWLRVRYERGFHE
jgi:outer membrane receptor for ferrienterochelin and colicin